MKNIVNKAIEIALKAHEHKRRTAENVPYVIHPMEVGIILAKNGLDDEVIVSGIIHDAVEQGYLSLEDAGNTFGDKVKRIVDKVANADKAEDGKTPQENKKHTVDYLREDASPEFKFVSCADKLSNIRIMKKRLDEVGEELWESYSVDRSILKWYHQSLVVSLNQLYRYDMYKEYVNLVKEVFGEIPAARFINEDLETIGERFDYSVAENSSWLSEHMISFLGNVISHFKITEDKEINKDVRDAMKEIVVYYESLEKGEKVFVNDEQWLNIIKLFYILRYFFKFHDNWIKESIGVNYLAWFKLYDEKFKVSIV